MPETTRRGKGKPFSRGHDPRRHPLSSEDRKKGGWVRTWLYIHVCWAGPYTREELAWARQAWEDKQPPW